MPTAETPKPPSRPVSPSDSPLDDEPRSGSAGTLHGRMLQVSRLATIGEMAAGVAHELNQPLTAIANYAQACDRLLARPTANLDDIHTALREIAAQAVRAGDILRRLRSLARSQPMRRERADINVMIEEIRDLLVADARAHQGVVKFELAPALPPVSIDSVQLQHVIVNLVRNGLEAQSDGPPATRELFVRTGLSAHGDVEIAICDNGPGLSAQALERLFDPFFSTKADGTGLGLAISNTVVRAHDGSLGHGPNQPRGACFYIRLPPEPAPE
jgi:two-component system, LuxR family, sensor kinase FixL